MFKWLFLYWFNPTDTPAIISKVNLWSYINVRLFKIKNTTTISYFIMGLNNLSLKKLRIFYKHAYINSVYLKIVYYIVFLFFVLYLLLIV